MLTERQKTEDTALQGNDNEPIRDREHFTRRMNHRAYEYAAAIVARYRTGELNDAMWKLLLREAADNFGTLHAFLSGRTERPDHQFANEVDIPTISRRLPDRDETS